MKSNKPLIFFVLAAVLFVPNFAALMVGIFLLDSEVPILLIVSGIALCAALFLFIRGLTLRKSQTGSDQH